MYSADVRVHPERALEEEAHVLGHGRVLAEQVLEHERPAPPGWIALRHLRELHRVAEQDERPRARAERERVGERGLPRLVDEEVVERPVELLAREEPGRAGEELVRRHRRSRRRCSASTRRSPAARRTTRVPVRRLLQPAERDARLERVRLDLARAGCGSPCGSARRSPTRLPRASRCVISRAPVHVLPEPGGPWTKRYEPSTSRTSRPIASSASRCTRAPPSGGSRRSSRSRCG